MLDENISSNGQINLPETTEAVTPTIVKRFPDDLPEDLNLILGHNGIAYAVMADHGNRYVLQVGGKLLNNIIRQRAREHGLELKQSNLRDINYLLQAHAESSGHRRTVSLRVAEIEGGFEFDLGHDDHSRIRITEGKVEVINNGSTTLFYRTPSTLPMVMPADEGDIKLLHKYLNMSWEHRALLIGWITYTLASPKQPSTKYPILILNAHEGSGKTWLCNNVIQKLIDPSSIGIRVLPRNEQDLAIATQNAHVVCFDNVRGFSPLMADNLCIAATGGAIAKRQLYTDAEQHVLPLHGAIVLNGIHSFIDQPDLAQRCVPIELLTIPEEKRKSDEELVREFQNDLPKIQRGIFDLIAETLKHLSEAEITNPERMIGFVRWLGGMEKAHGAHPGTYQKVYSEALSSGQLDSLQENVLAATMLEFAEEIDGEWSGTPTELLTNLEALVKREVRRSPDFPQNPNSLTKRLKPLQAGLASQGINVTFRRGKYRTITIRMTGGDDE